MGNRETEPYHTEPSYIPGTPALTTDRFLSTFRGGNIFQYNKKFTIIGVE
jgi:hypothetical protein